MKKYIISFDVATKSFAYVFCRIRENIEAVDCLEILHSEVADFSGKKNNKTIKEIERLQLFKEYFNNSVKKILEEYECDNTNTVALVEYQMSSNFKSRTVATSLVTLLLDYNVEYIKPALKNKIAFTDELKLSRFVEKYSTQYTANKNHATANMKYYISTYFPDLKIKVTSHEADSLLQAYYYVKFLLHKV